MATESSIVRFTNGLLACCGKAKREDLFIDTSTGKIIDETDPRVDKALVVDLAGRILSPGLLEVQLNGAKGVDFSDVPVDNIESYASSFRRASRGILEMGVTSFLPTLVTSDAQTYRLVSWDASTLTARHLENLLYDIETCYSRVARLTFFYRPCLLSALMVLNATTI
jgi:N-acetylglucosamine-6-phosphate deacetylase